LVASRNPQSDSITNVSGSRRISFAKISEPLEVPDLLALQVDSFDWLVGNETWQARVAAAEAEYRLAADSAAASGNVHRRAAGLVSLTELTAHPADAAAAAAALRDVDGADAAPLAARLAAVPLREALPDR